MKLLEGQAALVTGASRGLGRQICLTFARHGAKVAFTYSNSDEAARSLAAVLEAFGTGWLSCKF